MAFGGLITAPTYAEGKGTGLAGKFDEKGMCTENLIKTIKIHVGPGVTNSTEIEVAEPFTHPVLVLRAWVDVLTAEATASTKTVGFGTKNTGDGGDIDGFIKTASVAAKANVLGAGALIGSIIPSGDHLVVGVPNAMTEFGELLQLCFVR